MVAIPSGHSPLEFPHYISTQIYVFPSPLRCADNVIIIKMFVTQFSSSFVPNSSS